MTRSARVGCWRTWSRIWGIWGIWGIWVGVFGVLIIYRYIYVYICMFILLCLYPEHPVAFARIYLPTNVFDSSTWAGDKRANH